jgi:hypothetical protein
VGVPQAFNRGDTIDCTASRARFQRLQAVGDKGVMLDPAPPRSFTGAVEGMSVSSASPLGRSW